MHINIREGIDIPMLAKARQNLETLFSISTIGVNIEELEGRSPLKLLVKEGDKVAAGDPLLEDKDDSQLKIVAPWSGTIEAVIRGERRALKSIIIKADSVCRYTYFEKVKPGTLSQEKLIEEMSVRGLFAHIHERPYNRRASGQYRPQAIFIKAMETAPYCQGFDKWIEENIAAFDAGLGFLKQLTTGPVHLVHKPDCSPCLAQASERVNGINDHTFDGPHPSANPSVHIHHISPIESNQDLIWTLTANDLIVLGKCLTEGKYSPEKIIAIAGEAVLENRRVLLKLPFGACLADILENRVAVEDSRIISGDPLMGQETKLDGHMSYSHTCVCVLKNDKKRQMLHFMRPGFNKYTATKAYISSHLPKKLFGFTTSLHGEERAFIDGEIYQKVLPMQVPVMHLIKAILADNLNEAEKLGLLEIDSEDMALCTFIDPCKIEMVDIVKRALKKAALESL